MTSGPLPSPDATGHPHHVALDGIWRAAVADETLRRAYPAPDFDDDGWEPLPVPGHWSSSPAFAGTTGPVLHRRRFGTPPPFGPGAGTAAPRRTWLVLDGVCYTADVWLDGAYLGDTEGYFFPHTFEVTAPLAAAGEHTLAVEVACRPDGEGRRRTLLGAFDARAATAGPDGGPGPGGLWRPVRLEQSGPVRITHLRVRATEVTAETATVAVRAVLDAAAATPVELRTIVAGAAATTTTAGGGAEVEQRRRRPLAAGENRVEWTVTVPRPRRWWPRALGDQPLHDVHVSVLVPPAGPGPAPGPPPPGPPDAGLPDAVVSDARHRRVGLRAVALDDWVVSVNGERLFLKGAAQGPARWALGEATPEELRADVHLALEAGLDLLRLQAHVTRPEVYDEADRAGLLLWQDLPLRGPAHRSVRAQARRQAREMVDLLAHHPSVLLWCAHDEPEPLARSRARAGRWGAGTALALRTVAAHQLPSWNRTVLDRSVRSVLASADGTRPVVAHAGVLPHPPSLSGTDAHLSFGWYHHDERDLPAALALWPRLARFVGAIGAASVPDDAGFLGPERWPDLDWERAAAHGLERDVFDRVVPPASYATFARWRRATQEHQARVVRHQIETLRRLKYRPCGGFALAAFADGGPAVSPAVLDHRRRPKPAWDALRAACAPVIVVADRLPAAVRPRQPLVVDVHVVNDHRIALDDMMLSAYLRWGPSISSSPPAGTPTTQHRWRWRGDVPPDECTRIGTVRADAPEAPGPLVLDLQLTPADGPATVVAANRYTTTVEPPSERLRDRA